MSDAKKTIRGEQAAIIKKAENSTKDSCREMYRRVFMGNSTAQEGQYVLWDIMKRCGFFITNTNSGEQAIKLEAQKEIAHHLLSQTNLFPEYKTDIKSQNVSEIMASFHNALDLANILGTQTNPTKG